MGIREKLFRQKLADQIERLLTSSEKVFTTDKLSKEWIEQMQSETHELNSILTIYKFITELPEDESLQVEFLELTDKETSSEPEKKEFPSYGEEIMKEIDEFDSEIATDVEPVEDLVEKSKVEIKEEEVESISNEEQKEVDSTEKESEVVNKKKAERKNLFESILKKSKSSKEQPTEINDKIASTDPSLADKLQKKSITKLAESIALNERFLFSNELFNGNMTAFKRALNELDHIASLDDAERFIDMQLRHENEWNMDSEIVQQFIGLVKRRFN